MQVKVESMLCEWCLSVAPRHQPTQLPNTHAPQHHCAITSPPLLCRARRENDAHYPHPHHHTTLTLTFSHTHKQPQTDAENSATPPPCHSSAPRAQELSPVESKNEREREKEKAKRLSQCNCSDRDPPSRSATRHTSRRANYRCTRTASVLLYRYLPHYNLSNRDPPPHSATRHSSHRCCARTQREPLFRRLMQCACALQCAAVRCSVS